MKIETGMLSDAQCRDVLNWLVDYVDERIEGTLNWLTVVNQCNAGKPGGTARLTALVALREALHDKVNDTVYGTEEDRDNFYE